MQRRTFLTGAAAATVLTPRVARASMQREAAVNVVERFGFVSDGRADNYAAFHRLADFANQARGGRFHFPPDDYAVQSVRTEPYGTRDPAAVRIATYFGCERLELGGRGVRILLNGRFHRSGRLRPDGSTFGIHNVHFTPFDLRRCSNVRISGFEMDGGVADTTRDASVHEGYAHLVALNACRDVLLEDLDLHHAMTDGVYLGDDWAQTGRLPGLVCRNVRLKNVRSRLNARGGLAVTAALGLRPEDCEFSGNGYPGRLGGHAPGFGVDVEPDRQRVGVDVDSKTGDLEFLRCRFDDNHSAFLAGYLASYTGTCRLIDCSSRNDKDGGNHMILSWPGEGMVVEGGTHDAGVGAVHLSWQQPGGTVALRRLTLCSSHPHGLLHSGGGNVAIVENCEIIGTHREPSGGHFRFFGQSPGGGRRNLFRRNRIFVPAARKRPGSAVQVESIFGHTDLIENEYRTGLARPGEYFVRHFEPTSRIVDERFRGAFPGHRDTFRPVMSEAHDTRLPFSAP